MFAASSRCPPFGVVDCVVLNAPTRFRGFTLVELMITIALLAILLMVGIPSFTELVRNNRLTTNANQFMTALNLAKSEAIKRGIRVTLRGTAAPNWESGWEVFTDIDASGTKTGADEVLRAYPAFQGVYTLRGNGNFVNFVSFVPTGRTNSNIGGSFALCDDSDGNGLPEARTSRLLIINAMGRVRVAVDQNNNGVPEKDDGTDLASCTNP